MEPAACWQAGPEESTFLRERCRTGQALSQLPGTELHSTAMAELTDAASLWNSIWTSAARGHLTQQFLVADLVSVRESRALGVARTPGPAQQRRAEPLPRAFVGGRNSSPPSLFRRLSSGRLWTLPCGYDGRLESS